MLVFYYLNQGEVCAKLHEFNKGLRCGDTLDLALKPRAFSGASSRQTAQNGEEWGQQILQNMSSLFRISLLYFLDINHGAMT